MPFSHQVFYNQTIFNLTPTKVLGNLNGGSFTSGVVAGWASGPTSTAAVTFISSSTNTNVTNLTATVSSPTIAPTIVTTDGGATLTETAATTFKALAAGQTLTMAGLTFTAGTSGATAAQVATAFQSIAVNTTAAAVNAAKTLNDAAGGTFTSGTSADWSSGAAGGAGGAVVTFTSSTANSNVTNLTSSISQVDATPTIITTDGSAQASTESALVTFSAMSAGQTISIGGLTYTAGTAGATANQVASAFSNLTVGATPSQANNTPFTFASAYVVTPGVFTTSTSLSGFIDKPGDTTSYTFLATGTFTIASNAATNTTIAAVRGTITTLKIFADGALAEQINYGTGISTSSFGVTNSSVTPITTAIINAQRAEAVLQQDSIFRLINDGGGTFTGSTATTGGADQMLGGSSNDTFTGNTGNDYINGSSGIDTSVYRGLRSNYTITTTATTDRTDPSGTSQLTGFLVSDGTSNRDGADTLINIERLHFADSKVALDLGVTQSAGKAALLLGAVLPGQLVYDSSKQALLGVVINLFDSNYSTRDLAGALLRLPIWNILTGVENPTNDHIANYLLTNVNNGVAPSITSLTNGINALNTERIQGEWLASLATSTANQTHINIVGVQLTGLSYI